MTTDKQAGGEVSVGRYNRLSALRFVIGFGVVSMLADVVYEGARGIIGPYLATFGVSAAMVGVVTGAGEAVALVFRLVTGPLSDRTRRYWPITITGYVITVVAVPVLATVQTFGQASAAVIAERFGKAVRTPPAIAYSPTPAPTWVEARRSRCTKPWTSPGRCSARCWSLLWSPCRGTGWASPYSSCPACSP